MAVSKAKTHVHSRRRSYTVSYSRSASATRIRDLFLALIHHSSGKPHDSYVDIDFIIGVELLLKTHALEIGALAAALAHHTEGLAVLDGETNAVKCRELHIVGSSLESPSGSHNRDPPLVRHPSAFLKFLTTAEIIVNLLIF